MSTEKEEADLLQIELDDLNNVLDLSDASDESGSGLLFTISSYGVDHTVENLVNRLKREQYYIPDFQRKFVWSQNDASKFIESLLLGLPVPGIFLYKEHDSPKHLVIDGQQRLKSLQKYYSGIFNDKKFRLSGLKSGWNGKAYDELLEDDRLRLDDAIVHATIFKQDTPTDNMDSVYEVFERINTGGMKLSPQEIRTCVAHGEFNALLFDLNENADWRTIFGSKSIRLKDVELILRHIAFKKEEQGYKRPMKNFLTNFMTAHRNIAQVDAVLIKENWKNTNTRLISSIGERPFRPGGRGLNAAFYDSFSVALSNLLEGGSEVSDEQIKAAYDALETNPDFLDVISSSTADEENVKGRFRLAREAFHHATAS